MKRLSPLLVLVLLLQACGGADEMEDTFTFTAEDAAEVSELLDRIEAGKVDVPETDLTALGPEEVVIDAAQAHRFDALRTSLGSVGENTFRVTNVFLNVRSAPNIRSKKIEELKEGENVTLLSFPNTRWAEIQLRDGRKGYVSTSYIAQVVAEEKLEEVKAQYEGQYSVNFQFVNVRAEPNSQSQKLGEFTSTQIVKPIAILDGWARVPYEGKVGFVSADYLRPYMPNFIVRQEYFRVPILNYQADDAAIADVLVQHLAFLKSEGKKILTLRDFYELLQQQEDRDVRVSGDSVILVISNLTPATIGDIADTLRASDVQATFFLPTSMIGPEGIGTQYMKTLVASGHDIQSAGHSGDDLRSLTNSQIALELSQSRQILEDLTGQKVFAVQYPSGGVNDRVAEQVVLTGYLFGLTVSPSSGEGFDRSQFLRLPSNVITATTTEGTLKSLIGVGEGSE